MAVYRNSLPALSRQFSRSTTRFLHKLRIGYWNRYLRLAFCLFLLIFILDAYYVSHLQSSVWTPETVPALSNTPSGGPIVSDSTTATQKDTLKLDAKVGRIYIAALAWNNGQFLKRYWVDSLLALVEVLGRDRVFISIHENGSVDETKKILQDLDAELTIRNIAHEIAMDDATHKQLIDQGPSVSVRESQEQAAEGWIRGKMGEWHLRRIPYLAKLRNQSLEKLIELANQGHIYETVLFLNDVIFTPRDIVRLLLTNEGSYAAACSLDFSAPPNFYDTFALRDDQGNGVIQTDWPYFRSTSSRNSLIQGSTAVPVQSCWNGAVAMKASPFLASHKPLRFRAVPDSLAVRHVEGSECCFIHTDNPLSSSQGVYLNPSVRVAYNHPAYEVVHPSEGRATWPRPWEMYRGIWTSRLKRWFFFTTGRDWIARYQVKKWNAEQPEDNRETGGLCVINEMQILDVSGWLHI